MNIPHQALVLVADGRKLMFLRNEGDEVHPNLQVEEHHEQDNPATRDQGSASPGRAPSGPNGISSAVSQTDFHQLEEDRFAAEAADMLRKRALAGDFEQLIIAAPPTTLGELRKHYHKAVKDRLVREIDKDLTGHPIDRIEQLLLAK